MPVDEVRYSEDLSEHNLSAFLNAANQSPDNSGHIEVSLEIEEDGHFGSSALLENEKEDDGPKMSLATKAVDELYILVVSFCNVVEVFF